MDAASRNTKLIDCLKGVFLCRFDLSFGPVPVITYPPGFLTPEQSKKIAMRSLLRLRAGQGVTTVALSAFDEMGTMWIGMLGTLQTTGFYSLVIFFDVNVPKSISDNIDKVESLLDKIGLKFPQNDATLNDFAKQVFMETHELLNQIVGESTTEEQHWSKELEEGIEKVASQILLAINEYRRTGVRPQRPFTYNAIKVVSSLSLLAVKCNHHRVAQSLTSLLTELERT